MAKRKTKRKKTAKLPVKKAKKATSAQKRAKTKRKKQATAPKPARKKTTKKKAVAKKKKATPSKRGKTVKKKVATKKVGKKNAVGKKKAATKKKVAVKKKAVGKKKAVAKKKAATKKKPVAKKTPAKKAAKKRPAKKTKAEEAAVVDEAEVVAAPPAEPEEPGLPLKEVRARLGLIGPQIAEMDWLEGIFLYGSALLETPRLEHVDFIVFYRGLRSAARIKAAEKELKELIAAVLPIEFELRLNGTLEIGRLLSEGNPAAQALLGYAEPVFARGL